MNGYNKAEIKRILHSLKRGEVAYNYYSYAIANCNIKSCKYLPYNSFSNLSWCSPSLSFKSGLKCPNSIRRIIDSILRESGTSSYKLYQKTNPENSFTYYGIKRLEIVKIENSKTCLTLSTTLRKVTPQLLFVIDSSLVIEGDSRRFKLKSNPVTGEKELQGFSLLIANEFVNSEDSKSLYNRLNKEFIPYLAENGVNIVYMSEDSIIKNAYKSDSLVFKSPFERQKFLDEMVEEVIEEGTIDLPF